MDIQGYILDHWLAKMKPESPVLTIYDNDGIYYDILPLAAERGVKVIDTTRNHLYARLAASLFWCNNLSIDDDARMIIYRHRLMPKDDREWIAEPFACFSKSMPIFPIGAVDSYVNICKTFIPAKQKEIDQLFAQGSTSFNMINSLLDGNAYPELEQLTKGKSVAETTVGLLSVDSCGDSKWMVEWERFAEAQFPRLDASGDSLRDVQSKLWAYLLFSEFVFDLPDSEKMPDSLKSVPMAPKDIQEKIYLICDKIRNQFNLRDTYVRESKHVADALSLSEHFAKAKHLGNRVTFAFENSVEYDRFIALVKAGNYEEAQSMLRKNVEDVWYQQDNGARSFWKLADKLLCLMECVNSGMMTDNGARDFIKWYADDGYRADYAFRKYHTDLSQCADLPKQVTQLTELLNSRYRDFTERGVRFYQETIRDIVKLPDMKNQGGTQFVYPALSEGKRVVLVMVDAFRYEMGKSFATKMKDSFPERVECHTRLSYLPSVTRFGMAQHLDDIRSVFDNGKLIPVIGEEQIVSTADRISYLQNRTKVNVQDFTLNEFDAAKVIESTQLLVIRSFGIDSAGESSKMGGLLSMESELVSLARLLGDLKRLKFDCAVLVTDHGFMLQPSFRSGDVIPKPAGSNVSLDESRMLVGGFNPSADTLSFSPSELGVDVDALKMVYAKNFTVFRKGETYHHEGLSLQENVVPLIVVALQEEKKQQAYSVSLSYKDKTVGTVYTRRPLIDINTMFSDLFADDVNIRIKVSGDDGSEIGSPDGKFYNEYSQLVVIPSGATKVKQPLVIDDDYHGSSIVITAFNPETNATLSSLKLEFEND